MDTHPINYEAIASFIGMLDGIEPDMDFVPVDVEDVESLIYRILRLRDQLTQSSRTGMRDVLSAIKSGNYNCAKRLQQTYKAFWSEVFQLARTCQRMTRELAGCRRLQLRTSDTGLTPSQADWLARFMHDRL
jgi:hypothetical protein